MTPLSPRDHAGSALARLHDYFDGRYYSMRECLLRASHHLTEAGLTDMAATVSEAANRVGGDDADVKAVYDRLSEMLWAWPVTVESRRAA